MGSIIGYGAQERAVYATDPNNSRGRLVVETESRTRTPFQRDRDRIIHSTAFRRLKHKTQVFVCDEGDHYRTRLTHTIEVAQIARSLARAFRADEDLAEALALAHDLGHTPFGHAGERALDHAMQEFGGFDHNAQSLRVVTDLEKRYAAFDGLNLSWETLEGLVKHNGPIMTVEGQPGPQTKALPWGISTFNQQFDLDLASHAGIEAQAAALADDIAYNAHDLDDGLRAGLINLQGLREIPLLDICLNEIEESWPKLDQNRTTHELIRRIITKMVEDAIDFSCNNLERLKPNSTSEVRGCGETIVGFSNEMKCFDENVKSFLFRTVYRHKDVMDVMGRAENIVQDLFQIYFDNPQNLPVDWQVGSNLLNKLTLARTVSDYIAGMTDNFALQEHRRLFDQGGFLR